MLTTDSTSGSRANRTTLPISVIACSCGVPTPFSGYPWICHSHDRRPETQTVGGTFGAQVVHAVAVEWQFVFGPSIRRPWSERFDSGQGKRGSITWIDPR